MYRFVGWLLLLPLAGAFWLVMYIVKACVKKGGELLAQLAENKIKEGDANLVPSDGRLEGLLVYLYNTARMKNLLPSNQRDLCNCLGLCIQFRKAKDTASLQAGERYKLDIDAWSDTPFGGGVAMINWKIKTYNPGDWEKLVIPTHDLTYWLMSHNGLPKEYEVAFNEAVDVFKQEGRLELPATQPHNPT